jgi:hypothetical protein
MMRCTYPSACETPATIKLRSIRKTPEVTKILMGVNLTTESVWAAQPWQIPAVHIHMYGRLAYKFEGMTDMINGALSWRTSPSFSTRPAISIFNKYGWGPNGLSPKHISLRLSRRCLVPP